MEMSRAEIEEASPDVAVRDPDAWATMLTFRRGQRISMLAFPDVEIEVAEILPPTPS